MDSQRNKSLSLQKITEMANSYKENIRKLKLESIIKDLEKEKEFSNKLRKLSEQGIGFYISYENFFGWTAFWDCRLITKGGKIGAMNGYGKITLPIEYDDVKGIHDNMHQYIPIKKDNKWNLLNNSGYLELEDFYTDIIPSKYSYELSSEYYKDDIFTFNQDGQYFIGYIYCDLNIIEETENKYDFIDGFFNHIARVKKNNKWGIINNRGEIILPVEYDEIEDFYTLELNEFKVQIGKRSKILNAENMSNYKPQRRDSSDNWITQSELDDYMMDDNRSAYDNPYYNDSLDFDQQSQDFWENI